MKETSTKAHQLSRTEHEAAIQNNDARLKAMLQSSAELASSNLEVREAAVSNIHTLSDQGGGGGGGGLLQSELANCHDSPTTGDPSTNWRSRASHLEDATGTIADDGSQSPPP